MGWVVSEIESQLSSKPASEPDNQPASFLSLDSCKFKRHPERMQLGAFDD